MGILVNGADTCCLFETIDWLCHLLTILRTSLQDNLLYCLVVKVTLQFSLLTVSCPSCTMYISLWLCHNIVQSYSSWCFDFLFHISSPESKSFLRGIFHFITLLWEALTVSGQGTSVPVITEGWNYSNLLVVLDTDQYNLLITIISSICVEWSMDTSSWSCGMICQ